MPRKLQRALYNAQEANKKGEPEEAIRFLETYLEKYPEEPPLILFTFVGSLYFQTDQYEKAFDAFLRAFNMDPTNASMCRNLAVLSYQMNNLNQAAYYFEKTYDLSPEKDIELLYQAATTLFSDKRYDKTIRVINRYLGIVDEPKQRWLKLLIYCHMEKKSWPEAKKEIKSYLERFPDDAEYWNILANLYLEAEDYHQGAAALEIFYTLSSPDDKAWLELADIYLYLNAPLKAIACYERVRDRFLEPVLEKIVSAYLTTCQYDKAVEILTAALADQETAERYKTRGRVYYDSGFYRESIASLNRSLEIEPVQDETYLLIGYAALELDELEKAKEAFSSITSDPYWRSQADAGLQIVNTLLTAKREAEEVADGM